MTTPASQEFLQDFLSEVSDHLLSIGQNLLTLEQTLKPGEPPEEALQNPVYVEDLLRSFHTIKGLSSMMGLEQAAELSHALESLLRLILNNETELNLEIIDHMLQGQNLLQRLVNTLADNAGGDPGLQAEMASLTAMLRSANPGAGRPGASASASAPIPQTAVRSPVAPVPLPISLPGALADSLSEADRSKLLSALWSGQRLGLAIFTPTPEKSALGMNVNEIRRRFQNEGNLIKAAPLISENTVRFAFLVAFPADFVPPQKDEVEWSFPTGDQPLEIGPVPAIPPSAGAARPGKSGQAGSLPLASALPGSLVRVDLLRLEELVRMVGELVVCNSRLKELLPQLKGAPQPALDAFSQTLNGLDSTLRVLRQATISTRMVPLSEVFATMPLAIRELARASGKEVHLKVDGENTQVDRLLVERLLEPLLHLVRNAITHGIETPDERAAAGKPRVGRLSISGEAQGEWVVIQVEDDGQGIDTSAVAAQARRLGLLQEDESLTPADLLDLITRPGFTTRPEASLAAGRGIGMNVVMRSVRALHGNLSLSTRPGLGTRFTLRLPLTLTLMNAIVVSCSGERYAIPLNMVDELIEIVPARVISVESGELYPHREQAVTLVRLADLFHLESRPPEADARPVSSRTTHLLYGLVSSEGENRIALVVDRLEGMREVVVRPIPDPLIAQPAIAGATELGDGTLLLIVDILALVETYRQGRKETTP